MNEKYAKAYTEVLEIISHFPKDEYNKIPKEKINYFKENMDEDYIFVINPELDLSVQNISKKANAILISLFRDFFATGDQKLTLNKLLIENREKQDIIKREKYNADNIFKKKQNENSIQINEKQLIERKESFFSKFNSFIKRIFGMR